MADGGETSNSGRREQIFFLSYGTLQTDSGDGLVGDCFAMLTDGEADLPLTDCNEVVAISAEMVAGSNLRAATLADGTQAFVSEELDVKQGKIETETLQLEDGSAVLVQQLPKILQGHEIKLENGSYAFVHSESNERVETFQPVELEDGTMAYITLTSGTVIDPANVGALQTLLVSSSDAEEESKNAKDSLESKSTGTIIVKDEDDEEDELCVKDRSKSFVCSERSCRKSYYTLHHLKVHERTHTGDRPFHCTVHDCNKSFATSYGRKAHIRSHTGEKPYKCPEETCEKRFKTSGDLQKHVRTHTGERPFRCPVAGCERSFTTSNIRKVHVRTHTGERPYVCPQEGCTRAFASATNYKNHLRIHSGEKPYVCTIQGCGKRFTEYSSLYKHHMVHTQQKPYFCVVCSRHYRQASTLTMHKRTVHGIVETEDGTEIVFGDTVFTLANNFAGSKKLKELGGNVLGFSKDGSTFLALGTSDDSNDPQNSHSQFLVVSDPAQLATLEELGVTSRAGMEIAE